MKNNININRAKRICVFLLCLLVAIIPISCHYARTPPSVRKANRFLFRNEKEIKTVLNFMQNSRYQSIIIDDVSGYMYADFKYVKINNADVEGAVKTLIEREGLGFIFKNDGAVQFKIWSYKDIRSFIVWSGNGVDPAVEYTTQIIPMKSSGWNYVISDFDEWKKGHGNDSAVP